MFSLSNSQKQKLNMYLEHPTGAKWMIIGHIGHLLGGAGIMNYIQKFKINKTICKTSLKHRLHEVPPKKIGQALVVLLSPLLRSPTDGGFPYKTCMTPEKPGLFNPTL